MQLCLDRKDSDFAKYAAWQQTFKQSLRQIFKHMVRLERVGSVYVCVYMCVILLLSTCWAVWQFDQLTRAAQLSPVSPALSIDQQSLRHETATGNLSEERHLLHNLQHSRSFIRDSLTVFCRKSEIYSGTDQWDATDTLHNKLIKVGYGNVCYRTVIKGYNKMQSVYIWNGSLFQYSLYVKMYWRLTCIYIFRTLQSTAEFCTPLECDELLL